MDITPNIDYPEQINEETLDQSQHTLQLIHQNLNISNDDLLMKEAQDSFNQDMGLSKEGAEFIMMNQDNSTTSDK